MNALSSTIQSWKFLEPFVWFTAAYLVGSIPEAWLLAWLVTRKDLRRLGSGNIGVMNTALSVARWAGLLVFLSEIAKGVLAVWIPRSIDTGEGIVYLCVVGVVTGIRWPIWLKFKGGRGNTAGMAAFPFLSYAAAVVMLSVWVLARLLLNDSFKATRLSLLFMPVLVGMVTRSWYLFGTFLALSLIYLSCQQRESDDHTVIKQRWSGLRQFLVSPPRR